MANPEEDLDAYLDNVLDEFQEPEKEKSEEEFMALLQENMNKLLTGELDQNAILDTLKNSAKPVEFQDTISQTMNKLKASSEEAEAQVGDIGMGFDDAAMETMMKELEGLMENGDFDDAFGGVLNQLVSKELLFEPMKELADKYPVWLKENKSKISTEEYSRYVSQHQVVLEIIREFDATTEPELNEEQAKVVVELMQKMQSFGNPPEGLVDDMAPGMEMGPDGLPNLPDNMPDCKSM